MLCAISGDAPLHPVVSKKTGHVFEKELIEKHLKQHGNCPVTHQELSSDDLVPLQVNVAARPRAAAGTSVPAVLATLRDEWDALMLSSHKLKEELQSSRQQLSQMLYQYDAACRVIARLTRERDEARSMLKEGQRQAAEAVAGAGAGGDRMAAAVQHMEGVRDVLSARRKDRKAPPTLAAASDLPNLKQAWAAEPHQAERPGVTCADARAGDDSVVVTGGVDQEVAVINRATGAVAAKLQGLTKRVVGVALHPSQNAIAAAAADGSVATWSGADFSTASVMSLGEEAKEVVGMALQPSGSYAACAEAAGAWSLFDLAGGAVLRRVASGGAMHAVAFHPDGIVTGTAGDGAVRLWDVRTCAATGTTLAGHDGAVRSLTFNENGYLCASGGVDGVVKVWDLRKASKPRAEVGLGDGAGPIGALSFDLSGKFLAAAGGSEIQLFSSKKLQSLHTINAHSAPVTGLCWGADAKGLVSAAMDKSVKSFAL